MELQIKMIEYSKISHCFSDIYRKILFAKPSECTPTYSYSLTLFHFADNIKNQET